MCDTSADAKRWSGSAKTNTGALELVCRIAGPAIEFPGYGFQTWQVDDEPGAFAAVGLAGQMIYVHPASRTVIVKLSYHPPVPPANVEPDTLAMFKEIARAQNP